MNITGCAIVEDGDIAQDEGACTAPDHRPGGVELTESDDDRSSLPKRAAERLMTSP